MSLALVILCAFMVGFAKTSIGGLGILVVPLMAMAYPAKESTGVLLPMLIMADIFAVLYYRRHCDWKVFFRIFPITAIGVVLGYFLMEPLDNRIFEKVIALVILVMLGLEIFSGRTGLNLPGSRVYLVIVGLFAGISTMLANAAGPLLGMYFLQLKLDKTTFVGTRSWYFLLLNSYKIPFSADLGLISFESLKTNLMLLPVIMVGAFTGYKVLQFLNLELFKWLIRAAAFASVVNFLLK